MGICKIDDVPHKLSAVHVFVCEFCLLEFLLATHMHTYGHISHFPAFVWAKIPVDFQLNVQPYIVEPQENQGK